MFPKIESTKHDCSSVSTSRDRIFVFILSNVTSILPTPKEIIWATFSKLVSNILSEFSPFMSGWSLFAGIELKTAKLNSQFNSISQTFSPFSIELKLVTAYMVTVICSLEWSIKFIRKSFHCLSFQVLIFSLWL